MRSEAGGVFDKVSKVDDVVYFCIRNRTDEVGREGKHTQVGLYEGNFFALNLSRTFANSLALE